MTNPAEKDLFLDLRPGGTAEEIARLFPPPAYFTAFIDGAAVPDKAALMDALAAAFKFPSYFGKNWDSLLDCLRSLPNESSAKGFILCIRNSRKFLAASGNDFEEFADIAAEAKVFLEKKTGTVLRIVFFDACE